MPQHPKHRVYLSIEEFAWLHAGLAPDAPQVRAAKAAEQQAGMTEAQIAALRLRSKLHEPVEK